MTPASPAAERQRRYRERRRESLVYATADVPIQLVEDLIDAGWLTEWDERDSRALGRALTLATQSLMKNRRE